LQTHVSELRGVGPERTAQLDRLKVQTVGDLLWHRPRRYEDRRRFKAIQDLALHEPATVLGTVVAMGVKKFRRGSKSLFELILDDGSARLHCRWWNLPYMQAHFRSGEQVLVYGETHNLRPRTMDHPETERVEGTEESTIHLNRIAPIYPLTEGMSQRWLRSLIYGALQKYAPSVAEPWPHLPIPSDFLLTREAVRQLHFPVEWDQIEDARRRLALNELLALQLQIRERRRNLETKAPPRSCAGDNRLIKPFLARLGFSLTAAQKEVLRELRKDLAAGHPMRRLLQGDVGSGKTVVSACCALMVIECGYDVVLMAPTEILAEQHFQTFRRWFQPLGPEVHLQTGSCKTLGQPGEADLFGAAAARLEGESPTRTGRLVIGTHALIQEPLRFENLGMAIIDEQHKFGVLQREMLVRKGHYPHLLVMTATPIPRTLGLTLYGDLDISVLRGLPPGRNPVKSFVRTTETLPKVLAFIQSKLAEGRQAYVVFPRVEESGRNGLKTVLHERDHLQSALAPFQVGLLHGRLAPEERESVMSAFRSNAVQVLLTTPIIEVGVDVPNATIMVILNAEQFGLAQLHQLRGRIGRGEHESFCILMADRKSDEARKRLDLLSRTNDGFEVAEADLQLRGPGNLLGHEQSGLAPLRFADLAADSNLVDAARRIVSSLPA
jgi:ATP-dependent DNA helicase RecG